jgi:hypothetical protein
MQLDHLSLYFFKETCRLCKYYPILYNKKRILLYKRSAVSILRQKLKKELSVKIDRIQDVPVLIITIDCMITFREEWIKQLRVLPYDKFGEFIRTNIYPALNDTDRKIWNSSTISNRDLQAAVQTFEPVEDD